MIDPNFVERSALGMLRNHGDRAVAEAQMLSRKFAEQNRHDAAELWTAIASAIRRLAQK